MSRGLLVVRLAQEGADDLLDQHGGRVDPVEIAVVVIVTVIVIEVVAVAQIEGDLVVAPEAAEVAAVAIADVVHLLGLAWRHAAVALLVETGRAAAAGVEAPEAAAIFPIALHHLGVAGVRLAVLGMGGALLAVAVARLSQRGTRGG